MQCLLINANEECVSCSITVSSPSLVYCVFVFGLSLYALPFISLVWSHVLMTHDLHGDFPLYRQCLYAAVYTSAVGV